MTPLTRSGPRTAKLYTSDRHGAVELQDVPYQATDTAGAIVWEGGLEPFGAPFVFPRTPPPGEGGGRAAPPRVLPRRRWRVRGSFCATLANGMIRAFAPTGYGVAYITMCIDGMSHPQRRYAVPDPVGPYGGINLYSYAWADPLALSDPARLES